MFMPRRQVSFFFPKIKFPLHMEIVHHPSSCFYYRLINTELFTEHLFLQTMAWIQWVPSQMEGISVRTRVEEAISKLCQLFPACSPRLLSLTCRVSRRWRKVYFLLWNSTETRPQPSCFPSLSSFNIPTETISFTQRCQILSLLS